MPFPPRGWSAGAPALALVLGTLLLPFPATGSEGRPFVIGVPQGDGDPFVLVSADFSVVGSASSADFKRARELQGRPGEEILWFRHDGKAYWIRDPELLRQARAIFAGARALAAEQARLGALQTELGRQQTELGRMQSGLGVRQADPGRRQDAMEYQGQYDGQSERGRRQTEIGRRQAEVGRSQSETGRQQDEIGRRQQELGRQGAERMQALLAGALASGVAREAER